MTQIYTPWKTKADVIKNEARDTGHQCPKCKVMNLKHRKVCFRCGKRIKPPPGRKS